MFIEYILKYKMLGINLKLGETFNRANLLVSKCIFLLRYIYMNFDINRLIDNKYSKIKYEHLWLFIV